MSKMVKKKSKATKKLLKRADSWTDEDVLVSTGLPPQVEGQLRCYLKVSVNQILWMVSHPPEVTHVRLHWWGEPSQGTLFRPIDVKKPGKGRSQTIAKYPIKSGPKQFAAYLNDMGSLVLEVLSGELKVPVGRAQIDHISSLAPNQPINGFFPVFSADTEKVAELQVSMVMESLIASYDSISTIPTPDMSMDTYGGGVGGGGSKTRGVKAPRDAPIPTPPPMYASSDDPFQSPMGKQHGVRHGQPNPLRDSVPSYSSNPSSTGGVPYPGYGNHVNHEPARIPYPHDNRLGNHHGNDGGPSFPRPTATTHHPLPGAVRGGPDRPPPPTTASSNASTLKEISSLQSEVAPSSDQIGGGRPDTSQASNKDTASSSTVDLVSALLEKGAKLRHDMIISSLDQDPKGQIQTVQQDFAVRERHLPPNNRAPTSGNLFRELLGGAEPRKGLQVNGIPLRDSTNLEGSDLSDSEQRTVDLVVGSEVTDQDFKMLQALGGSPASSLSADDAALDSDLADPVHEDSILEELFYKAESCDSDLSLGEGDMDRTPMKRSRSNISIASMEDPGNARPPSRGSRRSSVSSVDLKRDPTPPKKFSAKSRGSRTTKTSKTVTDRPKEPTRERKAVKKTKPRSRSRSRSRSFSGSERLGNGEVMSDADVSGTPRSESSRVSFDPAPSDVDEDPTRDETSAPVDGLTVERLTLIGRVTMARVHVSGLDLLKDAVPSAVPPSPKGKAGTRGKPPRPVNTKKACTFFVEYQFPVVATSRDKHQPNAMATEVMRVASKKMTDQLVTFGHRSVFPVLFDENAVDKWWTSALVFKVYSKTASQKVPKMMGMCSLPLKSVLKSDALFVDKHLEVKDRSSKSDSSYTSYMSEGHGKRSWPVLGNLKVSVELASDSRDFASALARARLAELNNPRIIPIAQPRARRPLPAARSRTASRQVAQAEGHSSHHQRGLTEGTQTEPQRTSVADMPLAPPGPPARPVEILPQQEAPTNTYNTFESLTLHTVLMVPEGKNITLQGWSPLKHGDKEPSKPPVPLTGWSGRDMSTRNLYLVTRMFWCDDVTSSSICWGTFDPQFNHVQVAPMLLTASLLERMRNNFMVIEVWDKKTTAENDQLVGIVKLPLHQFYMSYRDRQIAGALLRSQYPVVAVDNELPIVSPFSGREFGKLQVLLAMGSDEQVSSLQRVKQGQPGTVAAVSERPAHHLERHHVYADARHFDGQLPQDKLVEHVFDMSLEGINGLQLLDNLIWGEADCFLQYHFPTQGKDRQQGGPDVLQATPSLKTFRTATTLCVPDPVFQDVLHHKILLPEGTPVQREILTACAGAGGGSGGIPFEVWCRHYYPNVRDQVIAKGSLPLAKLCAMVTMQKRGEPSVQSFSLPLTSLVPSSEQEETQSEQVRDSGLLKLTVSYKTHVLQPDCGGQPEGMSRSMPGTTVCVAVGVVKASGLQMAAAAMAKYDVGLQYASEVGVNAYVRVKLSFLQKQDERVTRTVARSFAPEFTYYMDFPSPVLWTELGSDALSLAEILEQAEAVFEIWHQSPGSHEPNDGMFNTGSADVTGRRLVSLAGDVLLGTVTVPLASLLTRKTGVNGWFPVHLPSLGWGTDPVSRDSDADQSDEDSGARHGMERVVGGLELSVKFAHQEDLERVVQAARSVGWAPDYDVEHRDWESADDSLDHTSLVSLAIDMASFPRRNALRVGQTTLDQSARVYVRYKFYDRGAACSKLGAMEESAGHVTCSLRHAKQFMVQGGSPLAWYLREEQLEIQVWVGYESEEGRKKRPRNRDKLIGSAYLDLASLADTRRRQHRISGLFPLFKPGASSLGGACVRAHVALRPHVGPLDGTSEESDVEWAEGAPGGGVQLSPHKHKASKGGEASKPGKAGSPGFTIDMENTFPVNISIERALHLPLVSDNGATSPPSAYVSYQTAERADLTCSGVFPHSSDPLWNHQHDTRLANVMLTEGSKNLVFKVWHKVSDVSQAPDKLSDKVLGFVSVDLCPLLSGFRQLCGWYNIMDFNGQCQGQIKVAVTPQEHLGHIKKTGMTSQQDTGCGTSFLAQGLYASLPAHLAWCPEQSAPHDGVQEQTDGSLPHFSEHLHNVKRHHEQLQRHMHDMGVVDPTAASRSLLFSTLRANMGELDQITSKLKQRLVASGPAAVPDPSMAAYLDQSDGTEWFYQGQNEVGFTQGLQSEAGGAGFAPLSTGQIGPSDMENTGITTGRMTERTDLSATGGSSSWVPGTGTGGLGGLGDTWGEDLMSTTQGYAETAGGGSTLSRSDGRAGMAEEEESDYTRTLRNAQDLLQAFNGAVSAGVDVAVAVESGTPASSSTDLNYNNSQNTRHSASGHVAQSPRDYDALRDAARAQSPASCNGGNPRSAGGIVAGTAGGGGSGEVRDAEDSWDGEEDTLANVWATRQSEAANGSESEEDHHGNGYHDDICEDDVEGDHRGYSFGDGEDMNLDGSVVEMVMPRPLNDVSSANFRNAYSADPFADQAPRSPSPEIAMISHLSRSELADDRADGDSSESDRPTDPDEGGREVDQDDPDTYTIDGDSQPLSQTPNQGESSQRDSALFESRDMANITADDRHKSRAVTGRKGAMLRREQDQRAFASSSEDSDDDVTREVPARKPRLQSGATTAEYGRRAASPRDQEDRDDITVTRQEDGGEPDESFKNTNNNHAYSEEIISDISGASRTLESHTEHSTGRPTDLPSSERRERPQDENVCPNFFLPPRDMAATMRMLSVGAGNKITDPERSRAKVSVAQQFIGRLTVADKPAGAMATRPKPSAEQAQRIAKIFAQKFAK